MTEKLSPRRQAGFIVWPHPTSNHVVAKPRLVNADQGGKPLTTRKHHSKLKDSPPDSSGAPPYNMGSFAAYHCACVHSGRTCSGGPFSALGFLGETEGKGTGKQLHFFKKSPRLFWICFQRTLFPDEKRDSKLNLIFNLFIFWSF